MCLELRIITTQNIIMRLEQHIIMALTHNYVFIYLHIIMTLRHNYVFGTAHKYHLSHDYVSRITHNYDFNS